jgi:hypothetical protein
MVLIKCSLRSFRHSKVALALPVTFLILLVSTLSIVSFTYAFSVSRINTQSQSLKVSTAKQDLISLNEVLLSTLWQPGTSTTFDLADSGGTTNILPNSNLLTVSVSSSEIEAVIFGSSIGKIKYELPYSTSAQIGFYLKGDSRTITNQSGSTTSQICIQNGVDRPEVQLSYRPTVTHSISGLENGQVVNNIRIYIVNLNASDSIRMFGELPLRITCTNTQLVTHDYPVSSTPQSLLITSVLDGTSGSVSVPISSSPIGALIHIETVVSNISLQRWNR